MNLPILKLLVERSALSDERMIQARAIFARADERGSLVGEEQAAIAKLFEEEVQENTRMIKELDEAAAMLDRAMRPLAIAVP